MHAGRPPEPAATTARAARRPRPAAAPTILVADPNATVLESTARVVESFGYRVVRVGRPEALLEEVHRHHPALVLVEPWFPGLSLAGLVAALRADADVAGIPLVFTSASPDAQALAVRHRAWGALAKPFTPRQLQIVLLHALATEGGPELEDVTRQFRESFRGVRDLLTAMAGYLALLPHDAPDWRIAVDELEDISLRLEAKAERLGNLVLSLLHGG